MIRRRVTQNNTISNATPLTTRLIRRHFNAMIIGFLNNCHRNKIPPLLLRSKREGLSIFVNTNKLVLLNSANQISTLFLRRVNFRRVNLNVILVEPLTTKRGTINIKVNYRVIDNNVRPPLRRTTKLITSSRHSRRGRNNVLDQQLNNNANRRSNSRYTRCWRRARSGSGSGNRYPSPSFPFN